MKKQLLILFLNAGLMATSIVTAQPILTQPGVAYAPGDAITELWAQPVSFPNPGSAGANKTWNFAYMTDSIQFSASFMMLDASSVPHANSFPTATVASLNGNNFAFYKIDSAVMQVLGSADTANVSTTLTNPEDVLRFPFNYNNTYTDPYRDIASYTDVNNNEYFNGTFTVTADAYGTITTPVQTYTNALRVREVEVYSDSLTLSGTLYVTPWRNIYYKWYVNGIHWPVAEWDSISWDFQGFPAHGYDFYCLNSITGVKENSNLNSFSIYPNPASDYLNIDLNLASSKKAEVNVYNVLGAEMEVPVMNEGIAGNNRYQLDVKNLPQGIYFVRILMDGVLTSTRQFIVAR